MGILGDITSNIKNDLSWKATQGVSNKVSSGVSGLFSKKSSGESKKCPKCKAKITDSSLKFCSDCGFKLVASCPKCNLDFPIEKKFCTQCGGKIK